MRTAREVALREQAPPAPTEQSSPVSDRLLRWCSIPMEEALQARLELGEQRYGRKLSIDSAGRCPLVDLAQEMLDAVLYASQARYVRLAGIYLMAEGALAAAMACECEVCR